MILRYHVFRLICLLIKNIFPATLGCWALMRKSLEKNGKNVILGNTAFYIGLCQQISVYMWPARRSTSEKTTDLLNFTRRRFYWNFEKIAFSAKLPRLKIYSGRNHTSFTGFYCKSIISGTKTVHSLTNNSQSICLVPICRQGILLRNKIGNVLQTVIWTSIHDKMTAYMIRAEVQIVTLYVKCIRKVMRYFLWFSILQSR